jgi:arylsulfatase A-like enzyme
MSASTLAALDCFLVLGLLGVYLKLSMLGPQWTAIARFLGLPTPEHLSLTSRLGFLANDIWLNLLAIPIVGTLTAVAFGRYRVAIAAVTATALGIVYFVELQVQREVGQYLSPDAVRDLLGWAVSSAGTAFDYVTLTSLWKLGAYFCVVGAIVVLERAAARSREPWVERAIRNVIGAPAVLTMAAAVLLGSIGMAARLPQSPLTASSVAVAAGMLTRSPDEGPAESMPGALSAFRQFAHTATDVAASPYTGRERDSDLIIFMMETGAAQALDLAKDARDLPGAGMLLPHAFVATRHYTTHPYSSDALYSVFSGQYPQGRRRVLRKAAPGSLNGLMSNLSADVPVRRVYVPSLYKIEGDDQMYEALGAETVYASDEHADDPLREVADARAEEFVADLEHRGSAFDRRQRARLVARLSGDFQALERAKRDIAAAVAAGQRYAVMFFPEIGHGPWIALHGEHTTLERGRSLMRLQDRWLREILDHVKGLGRLQRTMVAVTADHGVRTRTEDPELRVGEISDYMFRVPFLLYAPKTLRSTVVLDEPTSHIDVAPTLLALLGRTGGLAEMQGVPVWERSVHDRIYLLAFAYGGADGFVEGGRYHMRQGMSGATFVSDEFSFDQDDQVAAGDPAARFVQDGLERLDAAQQGIVARILDTISD